MTLQTPIREGSQEAPIRNSALEAWRAKQDVRGLEALLQRLSGSIRTMRRSIEEQIRYQVAVVPQNIRSFAASQRNSSLPRDMDLTARMAEVRRLAAVARQGPGSTEQSAAADSQRQLTLYTLAQLSAFSSAVMYKVQGRGEREPHSAR